MTYFFGTLALVGGTLLLCQTVMTLLGLGGDVDADFDADTDFDADGDGDHGHGGHPTLVGALSLRTLTAAATFGGLAGLSGLELGWPTWRVWAAAGLAGMAALFAVSWFMRQLHALRADGTVDPNRDSGGVAGCKGTVYVRVPGERAGSGKVLLEYAGRTVEMAATTDGPELPSGTPVVVRAVTGPDTADVAAI